VKIQVRMVDEKNLRISGLHPFMTACLQELPVILEYRDKPKVHDRLFPAPTKDDAAINQDWQETVGHDLQHLFRSSGEIVTRDLVALKPSPKNPERYSITFPAPHQSAWMNALNQARLVLAELFEVDEIDMNLPVDKISPSKLLAIIKIDQFGFLLQHFVQRELNAAQRPRRKPRKKA
jgi:hypothetical protein